jgi:hypothetical protein
MGKIRSRFVAIALVATAVFLAGSALAQNASAPAGQSAPAVSATQVQQPEGGGVNWPGAGYGAVALFGNLLYIPVKLTYAVVGSVVGGGTYLVTAGNTQAANAVWRSALGGDYVLTPQMIAGEQPINFSGPTGTPPSPTGTTADGATNSTIQPITPLPPPSSAPAAAPSISNGTSQPMDTGTGSVHSKAESSSPKGSIE